MKTSRDLNPDFQEIPFFSLEEFNANPADFTRRLREVCHNIGFFYIQDHGISPTLMDKMLHLTTSFFDLPQDEKDKVKLSSSPHLRGYGKLQEEMTEGQPDFKETYDFGLEQKAREPVPERPFLKLQGPNQWPDSPRLVSLKWKETVLEYLDEMQRLGERLLAAISLTLGLHESFFVDQFRSDSDDSFALLRLLRYPPSRISPLKTLPLKSLNDTHPSYGVGPHIDSGCLVILLQDDVGGLQVQNRKGDWIDAPPVPGTFVINIGKMLQVWSNHYFLATPHRVLSSNLRTRHSVPFFFEPNLTTEVSPLVLPSEFDPGLRSPDNNERNDEAIVYGEYMLKIFKRSFPHSFPDPT